MKYEAIKMLLENALDTHPHNEFHMGYTAKEIHKKVLDFIVSQHETIQLLKQRQTEIMYEGRVGKDE